MKDPLRDLNTPWRKVASTIYEAPKDSKLFGSVELDMTAVDAFIKAKRKEGIKLTHTHVMASAISRMVAFHVPEINAFARRGKIYPRESVNVMLSVLNKNNEMSSILIKDVHKQKVSDLVELTKQEIIKARQGDENKTMDKKNTLGNIPWPFRRWVFKFVRWFTVVRGWSWKSQGLSSDSFGSFILSNIGTLGLDLGFPALFPLANLSMVVLMGKTQKKPVVINDEVEIRNMMTLSACIDHRVLDASHVGRAFKALKVLLADPEKLDEIPVEELKNCQF